MRILLMMAPTGMARHSVHSGGNYPIALAQIAAQIGPGHEVRGYDPDMETEYPRSLERILAEFRPEIVGIGFRIFDTTLSYEPRTYLPELEAALDLIRRAVPETIICLGGSGFSFFARPLMERLVEVDVGFYLAGDTTFPAFVEDPRPRRDLPGILYREDGEIVSTGDPPVVALDDLAVPDFDLFPVAAYIGEDSTAIGIESKRGCRMKCIPCVYPFLMGNKTLSKSPARVVREAAELVRRGVPSFFFLDSIFNLPHAHAEGIAAALREARLPITWGAFFNASRFDEETARLYYEAGCRRFYFSFDGVSPTAMRNWKRPVTWTQQREGIRLVKRYPDAHVHVSFLFGSPGESWRDLAAFPGMLTFLLRHGVTSMSLSFARIYPNTKLHEIAVQEGVVDPGDPLLEPVFYAPYPSRLSGLWFHPLYRFVHAVSRVRTAAKRRS
jgi:anaerobic magnesium-protoporphyrin IX monomethyl ester cyclase